MVMTLFAYHIVAHKLDKEFCSLKIGKILVWLIPQMMEKIHLYRVLYFWNVLIIFRYGNHAAEYHHVENKQKTMREGETIQLPSDRPRVKM